MNENSLLEGLYNSMSDMALVLAEAFGLTEATRLAQETAKKAAQQGTTNPQKVKFRTSTGKKVSAGNLGVRKASIVKGGQEGVKALAKARGADEKEASDEAEDAAGAVRRARNPRLPGGRITPITPASPTDLAKGMVRPGTNWLRTKPKPGVGGKAAPAHEVRRYRAGNLEGKGSPKKPNMIKTNPK